MGETKEKRWYPEWSARQAEGIARAKANGVHCGRREKPLPDNFPLIVEEWRAKRLTLAQVLELCDISESTFYRRCRKLR